jgi:transcriptional regulator with XRE-family HTH domain
MLLQVALTCVKSPVIIGNMATTPLTLGTRIRRARERARLSQEELANLVGASARAVGDWENDRRKPRNRLGALEEVLGVRLDGEPENGPLISQSLLRAIANDENLSDEERVAVIAAIDSTLAKERGENAPLSPRAGTERRRPAS